MISPIRLVIYEYPSKLSINPHIHFIPAIKKITEILIPSTYICCYHYVICWWSVSYFYVSILCWLYVGNIFALLLSFFAFITSSQTLASLMLILSQTRNKQYTGDKLDLPETWRESTWWNAILIDDLIGTIQAGHWIVERIAGLVTLTGDGIAI